MEIKYELPRFLEGVLTRKEYADWLRKKARQHAIRDSRRWEKDISKADYKWAIHAAVRCSDGQDYYTGEPLKWCLIGKYNSREAQAKGSMYRRDFALLPTVDHEDPLSQKPAFRICGLRTNDCKSDLTISELKDWCEKFLGTQGCATAVAGSS